MKIVTDSPDQLVLKEGGVGNYITGGLFTVIGIVLAIAGLSSHSLPFAAFGGVFAVLGILIVVFSKSDTVTVDKTGKQVTVQFKSLKNQNGQVSTFTFDQIMSIQLANITTSEPMNMNNGGMRSGISIGGGGAGMQTQTTSQLLIQLKDGQSVTIAKEQHSSGMGLGITQNRLAAIAEKLSQATGAQLLQSGMPTLGQAFEAAKEALQGRGGALVQDNQPPVMATPPAQPPQASMPQSTPTDARPSGESTPPQV